MNRRQFLKSIGLGSLALSGIRSLEAGSGGENRPNILFIMTDQQHFGMMSCTGNKWLSTPAMDSIANGGVRFENAYVANPVCVPSRISMATGVMPGRLGKTDNSGQAMIPSDIADNSLGKLIKRARYDTFYGGKVHMAPELTPLKAGYDVYEKDQREDLPGVCINFIKKKRNRPFFAVVSFINPHDICYAYKAYQGTNKENMAHVDTLYQQASEMPMDQLPPVPENYVIPENEPDAVEGYMSPKATTPAVTMRKEYDEREWRIYRWIYCRLTELVDQHIQRILDELQNEGLEENTLIVFTSDHGNMDASHRLASKGLFYEESVKVPFLMKYRDVIPAGGVETGFLVSTGLDILPTLCDYAGIKPPDTLLGMSVKLIAEGKRVRHRRRYVVSENGHGRMLRTRQYKYCVYDTGSIRESLVDILNDPGELINLAQDPKYQEVIITHRRLLQEWVDESDDVLAKDII